MCKFFYNVTALAAKHDRFCAFNFSFAMKFFVRTVNYMVMY